MAITQLDKAGRQQSSSKYRTDQRTPLHPQPPRTRIPPSPCSLAKCHFSQLYCWKERTTSGWQNKWIDGWRAKRREKSFGFLCPLTRFVRFIHHQQQHSPTTHLSSGCFCCGSGTYRRDGRTVKMGRLLSGTGNLYYHGTNEGLYFNFLFSVAFLLKYHSNHTVILVEVSHLLSCRSLDACFRYFYRTPSVAGLILNGIQYG